MAQGPVLGMEGGFGWQDVGARCSDDRTERAGCSVAAACQSGHAPETEQLAEKVAANDETKPQGLKPDSFCGGCGTTKVVP